MEASKTSWGVLAPHYNFPCTGLNNSNDSYGKDSLIRKKVLAKAKFHHLNEKLYSAECTDAFFNYFEKNPEEFDEYYKGYNIQASKWTLNPVNRILSGLKDIDNKVIADMGCGDAKIAKTLVKPTVHSFDVVALNDHVTSCNISKVPLANQSVDIVVFCLSLMSSNITDYILEAHRILKRGGTLKIAEEFSRFYNIYTFVRQMKVLGFSIKSKFDKRNQFVFLDFRKVKKLNKDKIPIFKLKPFVYK